MENDQTIKILSDFSEAALAKAIEDNICELLRLFKLLPGGEVHDDPDLFWSITDIPFPLLNSLTRARFTDETVESRIDEVVTHYKKRNVPLLWWIGPSSTPGNLVECLEKHSFIEDGYSPGMALDLSDLYENIHPPEGLTIERVDDLKKLSALCQVMSTVFHLPDFVRRAVIDLLTYNGFSIDAPMHNYLACLDGKPVATSSVVYGAGVAGIYNIATIESARGQGIGSAITLAPLKEARSRGYRISVLEASQKGFPVYSRLGFKEYCKVGQYLLGI